MKSVSVGSGWSQLILAAPRLLTIHPALGSGGKFQGQISIRAEISSSAASPAFYLPHEVICY